MSSFNKKITMIGELTGRPTRQRTLQGNKQKGNARIMILIKKQRERDTHKKRKPQNVRQTKCKSGTNIQTATNSRTAATTYNQS